jgi:hypothetical protein
MKNEPLPGDERFVEHISNQANLVRAFHETWRAMTGPALLPTYADSFNDHFRLTKLVEVSLTSSFVISICSLFDRGNDAISLQRLAAHIRQRDGSLPSEWETRFKKVRKRMIRLYLIRSHAYAHQLDSKFSRNVFADEGFTLTELSEVADHTWTLAEELVQIYDGRNLVYAWDTKEDLQNLFPEIKPDATWG